MTKVLKTDKPSEDFNVKKIYKGIVKAMKSGSGVYYPKIANIIVEEAEERFSKKEEVKSKDIYKFVLNRLNEYGQNLTANSYERFKTIKTYQKQDGLIDNDIYGIIDGSNEKEINENSNKDARMISTQRDLIAGVASRSYSERKLMPTHLLNAHNDGLIHIHDTDYMMNKGMFNCFTRDTSFITDKGLKSFADFKDGDMVVVPTHNGNWKKAIVRCYGKDVVYEHRISTVDRKGYGIVVKSTDSHRWFNNLGEEQLGLNIGDKLLTVNHLIKNFDLANAPIELKRLWCWGFVIADGSTTDTKYMYTHGLGKRLKSPSAKTWRTSLRLCGSKKQFAEIFEEVGYSTYSVNDSEDIWVELLDFNKNEYLENKLYENLSVDEICYLYNGILHADGAVAKTTKEFHSISSSDPRVIEIIKRYSDMCGWFITNTFIREGETNFGVRKHPLYEFGFTTYVPSEYEKNGKIVTKHSTLKVVEKKEVGIEEVWCLEVEDDHSFILEGGIPTGNCQLINLKDMLDNGTVINGKMIEKPKSFKTACTVATQISLQVANGQYGGQTFSVSHLAPYVRVSYDKWLDYYTEKLGEKLGAKEIQDLALDATKTEVKDGVQTIQFQENTFSSNNGQTPFVSIFMYLNEDKEYINETAMIIEEMLNLRFKGMKNEHGVYVTPAFPKLLYVLDENNVPQDSDFRYLTDLAVKCAAKRMNPDFISAKIMREQFEGNVFPCMGECA